jgi:hypothetical protein
LESAWENTFTTGTTIKTERKRIVTAIVPAPAQSADEVV